MNKQKPTAATRRPLPLNAEQITDLWSKAICDAAAEGRSEVQVFAGLLFKAANLPAMERCREACEAISKLGGNLPDERLTDRTGPNDAAARGLLYCEARRLALAALAEAEKGGA